MSKNLSNPNYLQYLTTKFSLSVLFIYIYIKCWEEMKQEDCLFCVCLCVLWHRQGGDEALWGTGLHLLRERQLLAEPRAAQRSESWTRTQSLAFTRYTDHTPPRQGWRARIRRTSGWITGRSDKGLNGDFCANRSANRRENKGFYMLMCQRTDQQIQKHPDVSVALLFMSWLCSHFCIRWSLSVLIHRTTKQ